MNDKQRDRLDAAYGALEKHFADPVEVIPAKALLDALGVVESMTAQAVVDNILESLMLVLDEVFGKGPHVVKAGILDSLRDAIANNWEEVAR